MKSGFVLLGFVAGKVLAITGSSAEQRENQDGKMTISYKEAERQKQERFQKLYEEMLEKGQRLHQKALDLPYGSKYMWEYIDYLDGRMFAPMEKFTIGELTAVSDKEITGREESLVKKEEVLGQDKPEEQKELPAVSDVQIRKKSENSVQTERKKVVTKQDYERMTGKEKAEWLGISESDVNGSINRFKEKMEQIGIRFDSRSDMTEAFLEVWRMASQTQEKEFQELQRGRQR